VRIRWGGLEGWEERRGEERSWSAIAGGWGLRKDESSVFGGNGR
jgi:hypothetical protein